MVDLKHKQCDSLLQEIWVHNSKGEPDFVIVNVMYCDTHGIVNLRGVEIVQG